MTATDLNLGIARGMTAARGLVATWQGRLVAVLVVGAIVAGAVLVSRATASPPKSEYRTAEVTRGSVVQTVAVSGSVNPAGQVRLNFRSAGRLAEISVAVGQQVSAGQALARIEATDLENALANAKVNLANAEANLQRQYQAQADAQRNLANARRNAETDVANAEAAFAKMKTSFATAKSNLSTLTSEAATDIAAFQASLNTMESQIDALIALMRQIVGGGDTGDLRNALNAISSAKTPALENAKANSATLLAPALAEYQSIRSTLIGLVADFENAVASGADTTTSAGSYQLAQTNYAIASSRLTSALDLVASALASIQGNVTTAQAALNTQATRDLHGQFDQWRTDLATLYALVTSEQQRVSTAKLKLTQATTAANTLGDAVGGSYVSAMQNVPATIERTRQSVQTAESTLAAKPADIQSAQNSVELQRTAVQTAQTNLDYATLRAPTAGVVQAVNGTVGEPASTSTTTPVVLLANTGTVQLHGTVGEADVSKLKLGQVANITVDALGATTRMTGKVTGIDPVATIQQGVPVYGVDITIDVPTSGIRPGMSGTASVILASKQDVLVVPNLAIRSQGGRRYVQVLKDGEAVDATVAFGISNDTVTEVTSGLQEGDLVVLPQAKTGGTQQQQQQRPVPGGGQQIQFR